MLAFMDCSSNGEISEGTFGEGWMRVWGKVHQSRPLHKEISGGYTRGEGVTLILNPPILMADYHRHLSSSNQLNFVKFGLCFVWTMGKEGKVQNFPTPLFGLREKRREEKRNWQNRELNTVKFFPLFSSLPSLSTCKSEQSVNL